VPDAANLLLKPLKTHGFFPDYRRRAGGKGVFHPVIPAKTGERTRHCCREAMGIRIARKAG
jgi:hypothetical protein